MNGNRTFRVVTKVGAPDSSTMQHKEVEIDKGVVIIPVPKDSLSLLDAQGLPTLIKLRKGPSFLWAKSKHPVACKASWAVAVGK